MNIKINKILKENLYTISVYTRQIAGTLVLLLLARVLTVADYGMFRSYAMICTFLLMLTNLDYGNYILVSSKANVHEVKLKIALFIMFSVFQILLFLPLFFILEIQSKLIFLLVLIRTFFDITFFALILPYFQASNKFNIISYINIFYSVMTILFAYLCYVFKLNLITFLSLGIVLGIINYIQCIYHSRLGYGIVLNNFKSIIMKIDKSIKDYAIACLAWLLYAQLPALYVSIFIDKTHAAIFFAAFGIANIAFLIVITQNQKILPELLKANYFCSKSIIKNNIILILFAFAIVIISFLICGDKLLLLLYGNQVYTNADIIFIIMMLGYSFIAVGAVYGAYITAKGFQKCKIKMMLEASIVTIVSLFIFKSYGILGATFSFLVAAIYAGIRFVLCAKKLLIKQKEQEAIVLSNSY